MFNLLSILFVVLFAQDKSFNVQLKNYLDEKLNNYVKYEYQIVQASSKYSRIEINYEKQSRLTKNYFYIPVNIYDSKKISSSALLTIRVKLFENVFVASNEIHRNENLSASMFDVKLEDISMYEGRALNINENLSNYRSKTLVKKGIILSKDFIELVPIINKGDKLVLHTGGTGVDISLDVIARQEGCAGDVISVYANGSKLYKGKIVDKNNLTLVE